MVWAWRLCCRGNATSFCPPCRSLGGWLSPHTSGCHWHCTGAEQMGVKGSSCLLLCHTFHWPPSSACMQYRYVQNDLQEILLLKLLISKPWKENQNRGHLGCWMVIEIRYILLKKKTPPKKQKRKTKKGKSRELAYWNMVLPIPCNWFSFPGQHTGSLSRAFKQTSQHLFSSGLYDFAPFLEKDTYTEQSHSQKHVRC